MMVVPIIHLLFYVPTHFFFNFSSNHENVDDTHEINQIIDDIGCSCRDSLPIANIEKLPNKRRWSYSFQAHGYNNRSWLEYSMQTDSVYYYACRYFGDTTTLKWRRNNAFVFVFHHKFSNTNILH